MALGQSQDKLHVCPPGFQVDTTWILCRRWTAGGAWRSAAAGIATLRTRAAAGCPLPPSACPPATMPGANLAAQHRPPCFYIRNPTRTLCTFCQPSSQARLYCELPIWTVSYLSSPVLYDCFTVCSQSRPVCWGAQPGGRRLHGCQPTGAAPRNNLPVRSSCWRPAAAAVQSAAAAASGMRMGPSRAAGTPWVCSLSQSLLLLAASGTLRELRGCCRNAVQ